jgi:pre-mRNA-splicing factor ATP-dependent RNA helicase DHX38/PRP16
VISIRVDDVTVPSLPARGNNMRQRGEETPSHTGGLSETARQRLDEHRKNRDRQRGESVYDFLLGFVILTISAEGITAKHEPRPDAPKGLGDFQRRSNRDREYDRGRRGDRDRYNGDRNRDRDYRNGHERSRDPTPRSVRGGDRDAPSVRVPNVGWDSTPRTQRGEEDDSRSIRHRGWDAPTPRASRGGSPDGDFAIDAREWEEEQIRLDRDWYAAEEGGVFGDEEHNPLAQYEDLAVLKDAEIATKSVVCVIVVY